MHLGIQVYLCQLIKAISSKCLSYSLTYTQRTWVSTFISHVSLDNVSTACPPANAPHSQWHTPSAPGYPHLYHMYLLTTLARHAPQQMPLIVSGIHPVHLGIHIYSISHVSLDNVSTACPPANAPHSQWHTPSAPGYPHLQYITRIS